MTDAVPPSPGMQGAPLGQQGAVPDHSAGHPCEVQVKPDSLAWEEWDMAVSECVGAVLDLRFALKLKAHLLCSLDAVHTTSQALTVCVVLSAAGCLWQDLQHRLLQCQPARVVLAASACCPSPLTPR